MSTTFTIKQVPDDLAERLRRRAENNRRSLQKELLSIMEDAAVLRASEPSAPAWLPEPAPVPARANARTRPRTSRKDARLSLGELWQRAHRLGATSPSESAAIVRQDRDARRR